MLRLTIKKFISIKMKLFLMFSWEIFVEFFFLVSSLVGKILLFPLLLLLPVGTKHVRFLALSTTGAGREEPSKQLHQRDVAKFYDVFFTKLLKCY